MLRDCPRLAELRHPRGPHVLGIAQKLSRRSLNQYLKLGERGLHVFRDRLGRRRDESGHPCPGAFGDGLPLPVVARELARLGVPVFPCAPGGKRPIPEHGFHESTTEAGQVEAWWRQRPAAKLAFPTGAVSGVVVVDVDVHKVDGYEAFDHAARSGLLPKPLAVVTTPTGGRHLYFPADAEREQRSWQACRAGIDFRGDGGYIIVPPSRRTINGDRMPYRVETVTQRSVGPLAAQRLRGFLDLRPTCTPAPAPPGGWPLDVALLAFQVANRPEGERNLGLFKAACRMAEHGHSPREALDALLAAHFAEAIDLDTLKRHQDRIRTGLADIDRRLAQEHEGSEGTRQHLTTALRCAC